MEKLYTPRTPDQDKSVTIKFAILVVLGCLGLITSGVFLGINAEKFGLIRKKVEIKPRQTVTVSWDAPTETDIDYYIFKRSSTQGVKVDKVNPEEAKDRWGFRYTWMPYIIESWRLAAVDTAGNVSGWSEPVEVQINPIDNRFNVIVEPIAK